MILPQDLTPKILAEAIAAELMRGVTPALTVDFDGLDRAGAALAGALEGLWQERPHVHGSRNGATSATNAERTQKHSGPHEAEIVVCAHDASEDVSRCLASIIAHTDKRHRLTIIDDASGPECRAMLDQFVAEHPTATLMRIDQRLGYTRSANLGLRQSRADLVVLLNSDTIVTPEWLEHLLECARSDTKIGIVGPLSNAAHFQSVPKRFANGTWRVNQLPAGWTADDMARLISRIAPRSFPRVGVINGFCFAITRPVIDTIGFFDEEAFPDGYGEEMDYCFRALRAGFELAVADHAYVYHAKGRSYPPDQQKALKAASQEAHLRMHDHTQIRAALDQTHHNPTLKAIRKAVAAKLKKHAPVAKL
jgi:GT2 family glycosyltransferase